MSLQEPTEENIPPREPRRWWPDATTETDLDEDNEERQREVLETKARDHGMQVIRTTVSKAKKRIRVEGWRYNIPPGDILQRWNIDTNRTYEEKIPDAPQEAQAAPVSEPETPDAELHQEGTGTPAESGS